ncbi:MAG: flavodoxin family protein [Planctomycetota bacterium]|nr:flavodoxin family protein [Planctomycetota bacterium]
MWKMWMVSALALVFALDGARQDEAAQVLVAYYSKEGHTKAMAHRVAQGARSVEGVEVKLVTVGEATEGDILEADAIVLGSPVYNANVAPPVQEFINRWPFRGSPLKDKLGAAFVTAGGMSAGEELVQTNILHSMLVFGMVVVGGPRWRQAFGASGVVAEGPYQREEPKDHVDEYFLQKGEDLGKRVAELAVRLRRSR